MTNRHHVFLIVGIAAMLAGIAISMYGGYIVWVNEGPSLSFYDAWITPLGIAGLVLFLAGLIATAHHTPVRYDG